MQSIKGFEMQFNWIFILIAGALILSFFVMIAQKQLVISEKKQEISVLKQFDDVFSSALRSEETSFTIDTKAKINFFCTQNQCSYMINKIQQKYNLPVFAPFTLDGGPLTLWSKSIKAPFLVTNLLFITNPKIKFIIVSSPSDPIKKILEQNFPDTINHEFVDTIRNLVYEGHDHVRFVFINTNPEIPDPSFNEKYSVIKVSQNNLFLENQQYSFQEHPELLLAALFSQDKNMFETQLKTKIFNRIKHITQIIKEKASQNTNINTGCYTNLKVFDDLTQSAEELTKTISEQNMQNLVNAEKEVDRTQINCPNIY
ncbi:hypothetical protein HZA97_06020 [Candidatus Woesearchaeota archaeon]|nr:hypothetical protein [Candidatus Woesearchaeota archaeon]